MDARGRTCTDKRTHISTNKDYHKSLYTYEHGSMCMEVSTDSTGISTDSMGVHRETSTYDFTGNTFV